MIKELSVQYQIKENCQALGVSRSGYYQWVKEVPSRRKQQESELLGGIETPEQPNQIWVSDITYVATKESWLYLAIFPRR
jgi:hypothetical protein